jgi:hypothetical protein
MNLLAIEMLHCGMSAKRLPWLQMTHEFGL